MQIRDQRDPHEIIMSYLAGVRSVLLIACVAQAAVAAPTESQVWLEAHNRLRAKHCAPPLSWSAKVAASAQKWANTLKASGCGLQHSGGEFGENLAAGTAGTLDAARVTGMWYDEVKRYNFRSGGFSMQTGHFTQLAWRGTTHLGCARASCGSIDVWVCQYDPPGNVQGQYRQNVGCQK
jgi:pathogenesis-related protein 1